LRIVALTPRGIDQERVNRNDWVDANLTRRYEHAYRPVRGLVGELTSYVAHKVLCQPHLKRLVKECTRIGEAHQCEAVLAVLESPSLIFIAERVARRLSVPLYCFVMDGPNIHIRDFGYDRFLRKRLLRHFDLALERAERIAVAGEAMQQAYGSRYGKTCSILRQGMEYQAESASPHRVNAGHLTIGFAGSLSAKDAFASLLEELDRRKWILAGRGVTIRLVGTHVRLTPTGPQHIEYFGWRSLPDLVHLLRDCDFLYMPQPFNDQDREFAELSFPNKLCTYVPARRPIMLHTPATASLPSFFARYPCGPQSTVLAAGELLDQVEAAASDETVYSSYINTVERAFQEELNRRKLRDQVRWFLRK
jgi:hypothetical protein